MNIDTGKVAPLLRFPLLQRAARMQRAARSLLVHASRPARRFSRPALAFNLHDQFERLRAMGNYDRMRDIIVERDVALAGFANPMLARHGETSEAKQYSGREVGAGWTCPFRDPRS